MRFLVVRRFRAFGPSRARLLAAAILLVDGGQGDALGIFLGAAFVQFAIFDVLGLALLLVGVRGFLPTWHVLLPVLVLVKPGA